jgi:phenylalanyl-tRNA synthetase alpha chain
MPSLLSPEALARDLALRDLTDPDQGPHALQLLIADIAGALQRRWGCETRTVRAGAVVSVDDNYDRLGFPPGAVTRDVRYSRYVSETCLLRTHTSAMVPPALRALAVPPEDLLLVCPGRVYRRDAIDRLHTGTPHQLDLWRITSRTAMTVDDLHDMIATVVAAALPGAPHRTSRVEHPYTTGGLEVEAQAGPDGEWVEIGECGVAAPHVLAGAGLPPAVTGLAMGLGLDRLLMLRKRIDDIRILRSGDERIAGQLLDLQPYRPVSTRPAVRRDLSLAVAADADPESLGDRVRDAHGDDADAVEDVAVVSETAGAELPPAARERLGLDPARHKNVLLRIVLRRLDRTLTDAEANELRDRIYGALHEGAVHQWALR